MEPKIIGYITANAGTLPNAAKDNIKTSTVGIGGRIESNGFYGTVEGGYGTAVYLKAEAGKDFKFNESNFGLNTSICGQYTQSASTRDYYESKFYEESGNSPTWKSNDTRGYGQVALTYNSPAFKASLGVKGGVKTCTQPSLDGIKLEDIGEISGRKYQGRTTTGFVTPVVQVEAGKKLRGTLDLSLEGFSIGGKLYF